MSKITDVVMSIAFQLYNISIIFYSTILITERKTIIYSCENVYIL